MYTVPCLNCRSAKMQSLRMKIVQQCYVPHNADTKMPKLTAVFAGGKRGRSTASAACMEIPAAPIYVMIYNHCLHVYRCDEGKLELSFRTEYHIASREPAHESEGWTSRRLRPQRSRGTGP